MTTIAQDEDVRRVIGGVDTHKDQHVAAALDGVGRLLGVAEFPATADGYRAVHAWLAEHGEIVAVGVEGCGSWGAGLARHLASVEVKVIEVNRPNRQVRRRRGKSDSLDAEAAARAVLNGDATATPKSGDGPVEALRQLRIARSGAIKARTAAANQLHSLLDTAPSSLRAQMAKLTFKEKVSAAERFRPGTGNDADASTRRASRSVARRWRFLENEAKELRAEAKKIIDAIAPELVARNGVGYETAGQLLVTAGDNPERLRSEQSFAALCASTPVQASTGRTKRHRLNRGGDRHANSALWTIVLVRMGTDPRTKAYVEKRTADGLSKREIMRCLKRYVARELRPVYTAVNEAAARDRFEEFCETWAPRYPTVRSLWESAWTEFVPFLDYSVEIRRVIYSTNAIESLHARMRRATRSRGHFPNEQAAMKCLYLVVRSLDPTGKGANRWMNRWKPALNAFAITFEGRLFPIEN